MPDIFIAYSSKDRDQAASLVERLRNEGYINGTVRCLLPRPASLVGYAVTVRIRCSDPPKAGGSYVERTDWWNHLQTFPAPRVVVRSQPFISEDVHLRHAKNFLGGEAFRNAG